MRGAHRKGAGALAKARRSLLACLLQMCYASVSMYLVLSCMSAEYMHVHLASKEDASVSSMAAA